MRAIEFKNTTGLTLEGGPVTVFSQGSYVGEAMLETTQPNDQRLVAYAVELGVRVTGSIESTQGMLVAIVISEGIARTTVQHLQRTTYTVQSKSAKEEVLYIEHPRAGYEWKLREAAALVETTESTYRLKYTLPAQKTSAFVVEEVAQLTEAMHLHQASHQQLLQLINTDFLTASAKKVLQDAVLQRQQLQSLETRIKNMNTRQSQVTEQQKRIRENLQALADRASEKELRDRYVKGLTQQEDELEKLQLEVQTLQKQLDEGRQRLQQTLTLLNVEVNR